MKVPKSTYVMGAVVLGLFGLAIAKSAGGKDRPHDDDDEYISEETNDDGDSADDIREYEREQAMRKTAELEAERELEKLARSFDQAYGGEVASMGTLFGGVTFGTARTELPSEIQLQLADFRRATKSELTLGERSSSTIDRIEIKPYSNGDSETREQLCDKLGDLLKVAWGAGTPETVTDKVIWVSGAQRRATFSNDYGGCALSFEPYAPAFRWLERKPTSVIPFAAVGQPAAKLAEAVKAPIQDNTITWTGPGLGLGTQPTQLVASVVGGKVAMVTATTTSIEQSRLELADHLSTLFGQPKSTIDDLGNELLTWKSKPQIVLTVGQGDTVTVTVGKI